MKFVTSAALLASVAASEVPETFVAPNLAVKLRDLASASVTPAPVLGNVKRMAKRGKNDKKGKKSKTTKKKNGFATLTYEDEESNAFQKQIYPIGVCYEIEYGTDGIGSEMVTQVEFDDESYTASFRYWNESTTCEGNYEDSSITGTNEPYAIGHEKSMKKALKLPKWATSGSTVYTEYYTSNQCSTTPGSYFQMANGCVFFNNETDTTSDDYSLYFACNATDNSIDLSYYPDDTCDGTGYPAGESYGDECTDKSEGGDHEWSTFECDDGSRSKSRVKSPKSSKEPKSPKEPKEPKTPKSVLDRVTGFVASLMGSKKLR